MTRTVLYQIGRVNDWINSLRRGSRITQAERNVARVIWLPRRKLFIQSLVIRINCLKQTISI